MLNGAPEHLQNRRVTGALLISVLTIPVVGIVGLVAILVLNARRRRAQRDGTLSRRIAPPTALLAAAGVFSSLRYLGLATVVAAIILLTQGRTSAFIWSVLAVGLVLAAVGFVGAARVSRGIRRDRNRFDA